MKFQTRFDHFNRPGLSFEGTKSMTVQSEKDNCDINKIMERFNRTGQLPHMVTHPPSYGDARLCDFQTAKQIVIDAQNEFNKLPSSTRKYFGNDPQNFLNAITDAFQSPSDDKTKKLLDLGLLVQRDESEKDTLKRIAKNTEKEKSDVQK